MQDRCEPYPYKPLARNVREGVITYGPAFVQVVKDKSWWEMHFRLGGSQPTHGVRRRGRKTDVLDVAEALLCAIVAGGAERCAIGPRCRELAQALHARGTDAPDMNDLGAVQARCGGGVHAPLTETVSGATDNKRVDGQRGPWWIPDRPEWGCYDGVDMFIRAEELSAAGYPVSRTEGWERATCEPREFYGFGGPSWLQQRTCSNENF